MKMDYDRYYYMEAAGDIAARAVYDENGIAVTELLPGIYEDGIKAYKYFVKAGSHVAPPLNGEKGVVVIFGNGQGVLKDTDGLHDITELAFYVPYIDKVAYEVFAVEDMEFVYIEIEMNEWDKKGFDRWRIRLPYFRLHSECVQYLQDCKGPNTESRMILCPNWFGRVIMGTTRAIGEGTVEKGHPAVHQWNYCIGDSDFHMSVGYKEKNDMETVNHHAGDWSFIPAGPDHDLVADPGKEVYYVWFEHYTNEQQLRRD